MLQTEYKIFCEVKRCVVCKEYIEYSHHLRLVKGHHFHIWCHRLLRRVCLIK